MMPDGFEEFFYRATGHHPFDYQRRLAEGDHFPELLEVPTGTGKTAAAILGWLWRRRHHPKEQVRRATPRRLVYCLPMRVLVEQTHACAVRWLDELQLLAGNATFYEERLQKYQVDWSLPDKVAVVTLMGGEVQDDWREHPEHEVIIIGTQDMLLSRALNRGFAMAPQMWPVDFGMLNVDTLWVMDEVQLMGPGRTTSVQLQHFWDERPPTYGLRYTLWMSATLGSNMGTSQPVWMDTPERRSRPLRGPALRHSNKDLHHSEFGARWRAPKVLEAHLNGCGTASDPVRTRPRRRAQAAGAGRGWSIENQELIQRILQSSDGGRLVLVFVNQVRRAHDLYKRLHDRSDSGSVPDILMVHGRMRPRDRRRVEKQLQLPVAAGGRIVVTTQVLEAGVDIDADALFTEVCPWASLVQRLGRLNRRGKRPSAQAVANGEHPALAVVFEPPVPQRKDGESDKDYKERCRREVALPYEADALDETRRRLREVEDKYGGSLSPATLAQLQVSLSVEGPVLRRFDLDDLFDTDLDLAGGHTDVSPWIRAMDQDLDAYIVWRRLEGGLSADQQVPIHPDELCAVPVYEAREAFRDLDVWIMTLTTGRKGGSAWRRAKGRDIRAGDTVMVDVGLGFYDEETGWNPDPEAKVNFPSSIVDRWEGDGKEVRAWIEIGEDGTAWFLERIDEQVVGPRAREGDRESFVNRWMELEPHLRHAEREAQRVGEVLGLPEVLKESLRLAARWHDIGKAVERDADGRIERPFQKVLLTAGRPENGHPREGVLYAKSNGRGGVPAGFRHEVASVLAFLEAGQTDDLAAFLIMAHHGKVRLLPEAWDEDDPTDLCGVRQGDRIPIEAIPFSAPGPVVLTLEKLLPSRSWRSWQGRVKRLLDSHGPFLLAYLEALIRVADWRAS